MKFDDFMEAFREKKEREKETEREKIRTKKIYRIKSLCGCIDIQRK